MNSPNISASVIIPNFNGQALLAQYLPKVIAACPGLEIIVVDDASTDNSVAFIKSHFPNIIILEKSKNSRFAVTCNEGVLKAKGEVVILLNTDVEPTPDFLAPLLEPFSNPNVFAVGCAEKSVLESNKVNGRSGGAFRRGLIVHWRMQDQSQTDTLWASGGSSAFRKTMWAELNGMDPMFYPAYEEDRDLCYRALKRGWQICFAPQSLVIHHHEKTNQKELGTRMMHLASLKNHLLLVWKNITMPKLILEHLLWLPYHLIITTVKTHGIFFLSFLWALTYLPAIIIKRHQQVASEVVSDETILKSFKG